MGAALAGREGDGETVSACVLASYQFCAADGAHPEAGHVLGAGRVRQPYLSS